MGEDSENALRLFVFILVWKWPKSNGDLFQIRIGFGTITVLKPSRL